MNAEKFTAQIKASVVEENVRIYRDLFENTENATDPYWQRALGLYRSLDNSQKDVFFEVIRQTILPQYELDNQGPSAKILPERRVSHGQEASLLRAGGKGCHPPRTPRREALRLRRLPKA